MNYVIIGPYSGTATLGTLSTAGPVNFCDAGGNYGTAVSLSGFTNGLLHLGNGVVITAWNNWVTGATAGNCCFPKKTSSSDGNADRLRVRVIGCTTTGYSSTVLIRNEWNKAPTSLSKSLDNVSPGTTVTLTANFPTATNMNGNVRNFIVEVVVVHWLPLLQVMVQLLWLPILQHQYLLQPIMLDILVHFLVVELQHVYLQYSLINFGAPTATAQKHRCTATSSQLECSNGATSYRLDVATDAGFTSMVSGFNDLNVGNVTSYDLNL